jgi:hypothetical protein
MCDLAFVATTGAALSVLPTHIAAEVIKTSKVSESVLENWIEVVNVCAALVNDHSALHVRLTQHTLAPAKPAQAIVTAARAAQARIDFDVTVGKYGTGKLAFVSCVAA